MAHATERTDLQCKKVRDDLYAVGSAVNVVSQEQKAPSGEGHSEAPQVVTEEVQVPHVAMDVPKDVQG
jgi:hypothetical protein